MKAKTYTGDLSKLKSCIKVSGQAGSIVKVTKKLLSRGIPFKIDDGLNIFIKFMDALKYKLSKSTINMNGTRVCEHIEPLNLDIKLSMFDYDGAYGKIFIGESYRSSKYIRIKCNGEDDSSTSWLCINTLSNDLRKFREQRPEGYKYYIEPLIPVLLRRGYLKRKKYRNTLNKMKYYEA